MRNLTLSAVCVDHDDDNFSFSLLPPAHKRPIPDDESPPGKRLRLSDDLLMGTVPRLDPFAWIRTPPGAPFLSIPSPPSSFMPFVD